MLKGSISMSEAKKYVMTYEGVKKLEEELEYLKTVKRKETAGATASCLWNK